MPWSPAPCRSSSSSSLTFVRVSSDCETWLSGDCRAPTPACAHVSNKVAMDIDLAHRLADDGGDVDARLRRDLPRDHHGTGGHQRLAGHPAPGVVLKIASALRPRSGRRAGWPSVIDSELKKTCCPHCLHGRPPLSGMGRREQGGVADGTDTLYWHDAQRFSEPPRWSPAPSLSVMCTRLPDGRARAWRTRFRSPHLDIEPAAQIAGQAVGMPSTTWLTIASISAGLCLPASNSPARRLRLWLEVQVAIRSPIPASPANVPPQRRASGRAWRSRPDCG